MRKNIPHFLPFATLPTTMRLILLFLAFVSYVTAQSVSPCITICVEDICPKGYSDPTCFCGSPFASINSCVAQTCTPLAYQQWPGLVSTYCPDISLSSLSSSATAQTMSSSSSGGNATSATSTVSGSAAASSSAASASASATAKSSAFSIRNSGESWIAGLIASFLFLYQAML